MSISVQAKTDYTSLFSSLGSTSLFGTSSSSSSSSSGISTLLTDYASIKNGSYAKLMKAYYSSKTSDTEESSTETETKVKNYNAARTAATEFKSALSEIDSELIESGDSEKTYEALKNFADKYNALMTAVDGQSSTSVTKAAQNIMDTAGANLSELSKVGISIDEDGKMSVDEATAKSASASALNALFSSAGSFGDTIDSGATSIYNRATSAINSTSGYTQSAQYSNSSYVGTIYNSYT